MRISPLSSYSPLLSPSPDRTHPIAVRATKRPPLVLLCPHLERALVPQRATSDGVAGVEFGYKTRLSGAWDEGPGKVRHHNERDGFGNEDLVRAEVVDSERLLHVGLVSI